ncbi:MAG: hypothetical protein ACERKK_07165 [Poseidonibacter sp.]|uniref:hypothetical protein n=1 Tax=Poseidonibacter sp. TaxID=2321188 RepID=UPI00359DB5C1
MIFFRVTQNMNIKATDGTLIEYHKLKNPSNLNSETLYITTSEDFNDLKKVFETLNKDKYSAKLLNEEKIRSIEQFPIELGISNENEQENLENFGQKIQNNFNENKYQIKPLLQSTQKVDLFHQLKKFENNKISLAIIGGFGDSISEMVSACSALRILYNKLSEIYGTVVLDIYIKASNNSFYTRDKSIYLKQEFIHEVYPLSISVKRLCEYDYFIDSSAMKTKLSDCTEENNIDIWLNKFGIDYHKVSDELKYNELSLKHYIPSESLKNKINNAKERSKLILFHPYSADINKSMPQDIAFKILKKLLVKTDYIIVSTLNINSKFTDDRYINLSKDSKSFDDYAYIVSNMDFILTTETSTFHIADAFLIPTVVIFTKTNIKEKIKYYKYTKAIELHDESINYSNFIFDNNELTFYKFSSWEKLKINRIIKLLDSF